MNGITDDETKNAQVTDTSDPWAEAFAAVEQASGQSTEPAAQQQGDNQGDGVPQTAEGNDGSTDSNSAQHGEGSLADEGAGSELPGAEGTNQFNEANAGDLEVYTDADIQVKVDEIKQDAENKAIAAVRDAFLQQPSTMFNPETKALGAYPEHPDICKRDNQGVPRFYNPDNGREFTGDNPRRQAQEWCDDYNKQLADAFNKSCQGVIDDMIAKRQPEVEVMKFSSTYNSLDPVRQMMLDNIIEDYELTDNSGNVIGYSCDLNKALAQVDRQVASIRQYASSRGTAAPATGPALDMPTGNSTVRNGEGVAPKSLAEALEFQQNQILANRKK